MGVGRRRGYAAGLIGLALLGTVMACHWWFAARSRIDADRAAATRPVTPSPSSSTMPSVRDAALLDTLLRDDVPAVRTSACELIGRSGDARWLPALMVRLTDRQDAVRWSALSAIEALGVLPHSHATRSTRHTPDSALRQLVQQLGHGSLSGLTTCEIWAGAGDVHFPPILAETCLDCHAGVRRETVVRSQECQGCHPSVYDEWVRSAHAMSLSHVHIPQPATNPSETAFMSFGDLRGIACVECHATDGDRRVSPGAGQCAYVFIKTDADPGCAQCHAQTYAEWLRWRSGPQPRRLEWPPGEFRADQHDARGCVDCHMPRLPTTTDKPRFEHRWSARRNPRLLREAVHLTVSVAPPTQDPPRQRLIVTNLSGHAFPTGTCRREVSLYVGRTPDRTGATRPSSGGQGDPVQGAEAVLLRRWAAARPGLGPADMSTQLGPGERQEISLPAGSETENYRLNYVRDRWNLSLFSTTIVEGSLRDPPRSVPPLDSPPLR